MNYISESLLFVACCFSRVPKRFPWPPIRTLLRLDGDLYFRPNNGGSTWRYSTVATNQRIEFPFETRDGFSESKGDSSKPLYIYISHCWSRGGRVTGTRHDQERESLAIVLWTLTTRSSRFYAIIRVFVERMNTTDRKRKSSFSNNVSVERPRRLNRSVESGSTPLRSDRHRDIAPIDASDGDKHKIHGAPTKKKKKKRNRRVNEFD